MTAPFLNKPFPVITGIMSGSTPQELVDQSRECKADGAQGIAINLSHLQSEFHNTKALKSIIESIDLPFMFFYYRDKEPDDETRQKVLLAAADAGAAMIDVMGDLYDPSDMEITHDRQAIEKQKTLINEIHSKGAQAVISSHMDCSRTAEQVIEHLKAVEARGPDVVKIVTAVNTEAELAEAIKTSMALQHALSTPHIHLCTGPFSRLHRFIGPKLGSAITFAVHDENNTAGYTQPSIKNLKKVLDTIVWDIHPSDHS